MRNKILIVAITVFLLASGIAAAGKGSGLKQMWLTDDRGTYIGSNVDRHNPKIQ